MTMRTKYILIGVVRHRQAAGGEETQAIQSQDIPYGYERR